jgi:hypothetical protein
VLILFAFYDTHELRWGYFLLSDTTRVERGGEVKNSRFLTGLEPPIIQPVVQDYTIQLSRF